MDHFLIVYLSIGVVVGAFWLTIRRNDIGYLNLSDLLVFMFLTIVSPPVLLIASIGSVFLIAQTIFEQIDKIKLFKKEKTNSPKILVTQNSVRVNLTQHELYQQELEGMDNEKI